MVIYFASVKRLLTRQTCRNGSRLAAVLVMLFLWLAICAIECSPQLHLLVHKDAQSSRHDCLVTHLQQHSVAQGFVPAVAHVAQAVCEAAPPLPDSQFPSFDDYRLSPSRAPPLPEFFRCA
jgi:hypothetical protein